MRTTMLRRSKMSKERALALDEILPNNPSNYDSAPGVYIRTDKDRELDVLWQGFKVHHREERSAGFYLTMGFITGAVCTIIMAMLMNLGNPVKDNMADLNLWKKSITKPPAITVTPSTQTETASTVKNTEYTVKSGDTLGGIANKFYGVSTPDKVKVIQDANNLSSPDSLQIDQNLIIPMVD